MPSLASGKVSMIDFASAMSRVFRRKTPPLPSRVPFADLPIEIELDRRAYLGGHDGHDSLARYARLCFQQRKDTGGRWGGSLSLGVRLVAHDENSFQDHCESGIRPLPADDYSR